MIIKSPAILFTHAKPENLFGKTIQFPLSRIMIAITFMFPATIFQQLMRQADFLGSLQTPIQSIGGLIILMFFYSLYTRVIEKRKPLEFSTQGMFSEFWFGTAAGIVIISLVVLELFLAGFYEIEGFSFDAGYIINYIFIFSIAAFVEEVLFRLILFKLLEELLGTWTSIAFQIFLFGFAHAFNPNATTWSSIAIGIEAGILLSAIFIYTRRVWLVFGFHFAWNYFLSIIYDLPVSGFNRDGIINNVVDGPEIITGGTFGPEASVLAMIFCLLASYYFIKLSIMKNRIISPIWARNKKTV